MRPRSQTAACATSLSHCVSQVSAACLPAVESALRAVSLAGAHAVGGPAFRSSRRDCAGERLLKVEFTTVFEYLQLLRIVADELQARVRSMHRQRTAMLQNNIIAHRVRRRRSAARTPCTTSPLPFPTFTFHGALYNSMMRFPQNSHRRLCCQVIAAGAQNTIACRERGRRTRTQGLASALAAGAEGARCVPTEHCRSRATLCAETLPVSRPSVQYLGARRVRGIVQTRDGRAAAGTKSDGGAAAVWGTCCGVYPSAAL